MFAASILGLPDWVAFPIASFIAFLAVAVLGLWFVAGRKRNMAHLAELAVLREENERLREIIEQKQGGNDASSTAVIGLRSTQS